MMDRNPMTLSRIIGQVLARWLSVAALVGVALSTAAAQAPGRTITIIVPFTPATTPSISWRG
jgi:hypothetical protein